MLLIKESSLIRLIKKPGRYYISGAESIAIGIDTGSSISTREIITSIGD